jgi:hypothetical protein
MQKKLKSEIYNLCALTPKESDAAVCIVARGSAGEPLCFGKAIRKKLFGGRCWQGRGAQECWSDQTTG